MSILTTGKTLLSALNKGQSLPDPVSLKTIGVITSLVTTGIASVATILMSLNIIDSIDPELIASISSVSVSVIGLFLAYIQVATTDKIGFTSKDSEE